MSIGKGFYISNQSTGDVTINSSGGNLVSVLSGGVDLFITCKKITGTDASSWSVR